MSKSITFTYEDKDYTLEYSRNSIRAMERKGFIADDIATKPMSVLPDLFAGAFVKNHPTTKRETIDKIYEMMADKRTLVEALIELYNDPIEALLDEPKEGNVKWSPNWNMDE